MKNVICLLISTSLVGLLFGQDEYKTIFKNNDSTKVSGFGTVSLDFGSINGNLSLIMGGEGAVLINRSFYIGFYGRGLTTQPTYEYSKYNSRIARNVNLTQRAAFGHGGLLVGAVIRPKSPIHFGFSGKIGIGGIGLFDEYYDNSSYNSNYDYQENYNYLGPVYVLTPQIDLEMNLTRWFKFRSSLGYQYVSSASLNYFTFENGNFVEKELLNSEDFSTPTFSLGFVFGWFD